MLEHILVCIEMYTSTILVLLLCFQYSQGDSKTCSVDPTTNRVENAALKKPATQSSTFQSATASKAVDGNKNPRYTDGSCIHTHWQEGQPLYQWWMVDLERKYRIDSVNITNRLNFEDRQRDFDIFVSLNSTFDDDGHLTDDSLCIHVSGEMGRGETRTFTCQMNIFGQYIQIFMETLEKRNMNICEVTVEGYPAICIDGITNTSSTSEPTLSTASTTQPKSSTTLLSTSTETTTETVADSTTIPITTSETTTDAILLKSTTATLETTATTNAMPPSTSMKTSTTLPLQGNNSTTATPTCPCVCGVPTNTTNLTKEVLEELVMNLVKELTVNKKETSMSKRKLISVGDERQSAETIGFIGVIALCIPVIIIVLFDLINFCSLA